MDLKAKSLAYVVAHNPSLKQSTFNHESSMLQCRWNNKPINHMLQKELYSLISTKTLKDYWVFKGKVTEEQFSQIDFKALGRCMSALPYHMKRFIAKWTSSVTPHGKTSNNGTYDTVEIAPSVERLMKILNKC